MKNSVHIIIGSKGGIGKSFIASKILEFLRDYGYCPVGIDADPSTKTLSKFTEFNINRVKELIDEDGRVDERAFDGISEAMIEEQSHPFIMDIGAAGHISFINYAIEVDMFNALHEEGKKVFLHMPVVGGQSQQDTVDCLNDIIPLVPKHIKIVIWRNEHATFGKALINGIDFEKSNEYKEIEARIYSVITIARLNAATSGKDVKEMLEKSWSFTRAIESKEFSFMARRRLKVVRYEMYLAMCAVFGGDPEKFAVSQNNSEPAAAE